MSRVRFVVDESGALVVTPQFSRCVDLRLLVAGAEVRIGRVDPLVLPWDSYGYPGWVMDGTPPDAWAITHWVAGRAGLFGVAVQLSGAFEAQGHDLLDVTITRWRRFNRWAERGGLAGDRLPIAPTNWAFRSCTAERDTLGALALLLASEPHLRGRLADRRVTQRLALDLADGLIAAPSERYGARRDTTDVLIAMRGAGFKHPYGRPLAEETLPSVEQVRGAIRAQLESNPYRAGRPPISDEAMVRVIRRSYIDVTPWPFAALV